MKNKKFIKKKINSEIQQMQELHVNFESQIKKRLSKLKAKSAQSLAENELRESEELFRLSFDHAAIGIAHVDLATGRWIRVNKRFCEIAGWSEKELLSQTFLDTTHPDDHKVDLELIGDVLKGKVPSINMEKRYIRKDGSVRWVYATASITRYPTGEPKYGIAIVEDIHEQKEAGNTLKLLAETSKILGESLDYKETLSSVVELLVPQFADWCTIDLLGEDNATYERVKVGYTEPLFRNKKIADKLYQYPPKPGSKSLIWKAIHTGKPILVQRINRRKTQEYVYDEIHLKTVLSMEQKSFMAVPLIARGKTIGAVSFRMTKSSGLYSKVDLLFAEQIANRIAFAVDNARLYNQAQKAVGVRDDFLAIASHELKTSLTTIKALAQILQRDNEKAGSGTDRSLNLLTKMDTQLNRTTKLINDLLDVGRIHRGRFTMIKEALDIDAVVREAVENCQRFSRKHNIVIRGYVKEEVYADRDRIHQVLVNLITNAIKYSFDAFDIIVTLRKDKKNVIIAVQDFGIGIEKDKTQKIFERFFRADSQASDRISGLGLGLYISNELIKQHGGSIQVESKVGQGSTFSIALPRLSPLSKKEGRILEQNVLNY
jgi:PAS domain S-box-containing protein